MPLPELVELVDRRLRAEVTTVVFYRQWENNLQSATLTFEDFVRYQTTPSASDETAVKTVSPDRTRSGSVASS
jgi:hypothetical protein